MESHSIDINPSEATHALYSGSNSKELLDALYALGLCCGALVEQHRQLPQQQQQQQQQMMMLQQQQSEYLSRALAIIDAYALSFRSIVELLLHVSVVLGGLICV